MNLVSIVIEGDEQHLDSIKDKLSIAIDSSWQKGSRTRSGKLRENSGFTACICDCSTPFRMIEELSDFLRYIDNKHLNFKQLELNARLSIGVTVGDQQQFIATFDFQNDLLELVSKLGLHLSISAYPTTDE